MYILSNKQFFTYLSMLYLYICIYGLWSENKVLLLLVIVQLYMVSQGKETLVSFRVINSILNTQ